MGRAVLTTETWVARANSIHENTYSYDKVVYAGYGKPVVITCHTHGDFTQRENNHRNGAGCPVCGVNARVDKRRHDFQSFVTKARQVHGDYYTYPPAVVSDSRTKVKIMCPVHGEFTQLAYTHLGGKGCTSCGYTKNGNSQQIGLSEFMRRAASEHGSKYEYVSMYTGMHSNMRISCPEHGEFKQTPSNHLKGAGCPRCVNHVSKGEVEIYEFLKSIGVEVIASDRSIIRPYELDIYIPSHGIAIEFNGLWFHREELVKGKTLKKYELCMGKGVKLIQIFEDEWRDKTPAIKARLEAILGFGVKTYARKCVVSRASKQEASVFFNSWHTQGAGPSLSHVWKLAHNGDTVAMASFYKNRFNNEGWELLRYCSMGTVTGGISKLVSAFAKDMKVNSIRSYADLRWGDGEGYKAAGFEFLGVSPPDYWWVDPSTNKRVSRYKMQRHKLGMPEKEYAKANGMYKVMGVGHKKWLWTSKTNIDTSDNLVL